VSLKTVFQSNPQPPLSGAGPGSIVIRFHLVHPLVLCKPVQKRCYAKPRPLESQEQ